MKRFLALAALVLGLASCQTEPEGLDVNVGGEVDTVVTVTIPETETRANSAEGAIKNLVETGNYTIRYVFEVYYGEDVNQKAVQKQVLYSDGKSVSFPVRLVPGRDYNFVAWADIATQPEEEKMNKALAYEGNTTDVHYNTTNLQAISLLGEWNAMDETRDAYTGFHNTKGGEKYTGSSSINIRMTRPFAKLRVITTDMVELGNLNITPVSAKVTYSAFSHESFNALDGTYSGEISSKTHTYAIADYADFVDTAKEDSHKVLFTDYFFADASDVVKFELDVYEGDVNNQNATTLIKHNDFKTDIPAQRNYLTTIQGNILTDGNNITVTVENDGKFENAGDASDDAPYYKETISSAAEFLAALDKAGEFIVISAITIDGNLINAGSTVNNGQASTFATRADGKTTIVDLNGHIIEVKNTSGAALVTIDEGDTVTFVGEGTIKLTDDSNASFINSEEGTVEVAAVNHPNTINNIPVIEGDVVDYADLLREAFNEGRDYTMVYNVTTSEPYTLAAGKTMTLDLNGKTITGTDKSNGSFGLITNQGNLTVKNGTITLEAVNNREWNAYSSVISNTVGGNLVVENVTLEHLGGTDMAYGIDNLTNGKGTSAIVNINNGAVVKSPYRAVRQFLNGVEATNELYVNAGATIDGSNNKSIWMQDPSANANTGKLVVNEGATLKGNVYLYVCEGSTSWPVSVSIADAAFDGESTVVTGNVPSGMSVENVNGIWTIVKCYKEIENGYSINSAAGLKWLSEEVLNGNTFEGKTIELAANIDLTGVTTNGDSFGPIGRYCSGQGVNKPFKGHFNGVNHTIKGIYQSGWDFGYEWGTTGYLGLFGYVIDATVENLTIEVMESVVEGGTLAAIAGRADGECTFKNITVKNTKLGTYNNRCGGIVGWTGGYYKDEAETEVACYFTFENINICEDVVLGGLWGSFDSSIGGIMGQLNSAGSASFKNVTVSCRIDAYNDCTASYDYYLYRMCGMLIGQMTKTTTIDGSTYPDVAAYGITFDNVTVNYGKWMNYHYCEPTPGLNGGRGMRVEPGFTYDGLPADFGHTQCTDNHYNCIPFDQLFGGTQTACKGVKAWDGVTVNYPVEYTCDLCGEQHNVK